MSVRMNPGVAGAIPVNNLTQLLFTLTGANMAVATDQSFVKGFSGTLYVPTIIACVWASGAFGTACAGGIYTAAAKGGTAIVAAAQSYAALTGAGTSVNCAIAAAGPFSATPILSLTTANTGALTANFVVYGVILS